MKNGLESPAGSKAASIWASILKRTPDPVHFVLLGWWLRGAAANRAELVEALGNEAALPERLKPVLTAVKRLKHTDPDNLGRKTLTPTFPGLRRSVAAKALAAIATLTTLGCIYLLQSPETHDYQTAVGGYLRASLREGSVVELNTDTHLNVRLGRAERLIRMSRGEATFTVAHDTQRPFIVDSDDMRVRAVGTAFTVRVHSPGHESVLVTHGKVAVTIRPSRSVTYVGTGEIVDFNAGRLSVHTADSSEKPARLSWHEGRLRFSGSKLTEVVEEFNRYNTRKLVVADPAIADLSIGGQFSIHGIENFLVGWRAQVHGGRTERRLDPISGADVILLYGPSHKG